MSCVFVDTGTWFARFVPTDADHLAAKAWLERNTLRLVTTDDVVDELLTLLKIRGEYARALVIGAEMLNGNLCDLDWVTPHGCR